MLFDFPAADTYVGDFLIQRHDDPRWGVDSEYATLTDVLVSAPAHLEVVPCNSVSIETIEQGLGCCTDTASLQHAALVSALERQGVRCHLVAPALGLPDMSFTRDAVLMTPWGLLELRPNAEHRRGEVARVREMAETLGLPLIGAVGAGFVEGGDVCLLRPGIIVIGQSGERTDEAGAKALARIFEERGWRAIICPFDPHFLHLDTLFTLVGKNRAVACVEELPQEFIDEIKALGIELIPASCREVKKLGANLVALGRGRVLSSADNGRINGELERLGYEVVPVEIDQFTRCGGGVHCLTMPLARLPG